MSLLIGLLTFILVMNCLFLMLLILIQLPKKEAGAGIAFGGAATDALFGAGSGNALTKMTKYAGSIFVGLSVLLSVLEMQAARQGSRRLEQEISRQASSPGARTPAPFPTNLATQAPVAALTSNAPAAMTLTASTNLMSVTVPAPAATSSAPVKVEEPVVPEQK